MIKEVGHFDVISGELIVSDPCYKKGTWCAGTLFAVNGQWTASIDVDDGIIQALIVEHTTATAKGDWVKTDIEGGVDSGQMSVFDSDFFRNNKEAAGMNVKDSHEEDGAGLFYAACCATTEDQAGVLPHGAVSSTAYGDGSYDIYVKKDKSDNCVAVKIDFIGEEEDIEREDEEDLEDEAARDDFDEDEDGDDY